jgi:protein subunit release factor A
MSSLKSLSSGTERTGKKLLFSVTKKDLIRQTFCTGGNGGQHRNAKANGVRFIHEPSGARAEHRDGRDQHKNEIEAFIKLTETKEFKNWLKTETARRLGQPVAETEAEIRARVNRMVDDGLRDGTIKVEEYDGA